MSGKALIQTMTPEQIRSKIIVIDNQNVLLDSDVAAIYGVETREINQAVSNNPDKFPERYILSLDKETKTELIKNFDNCAKLRTYPGNPKIFTEKGLYMLATILKSPIATATTIAIIETFTQIRELQATMAQMSETHDKTEQKNLMQRGGKIMVDLLNPGLSTVGTETTFEINLAMMKIKHVVKKTKNKGEK